MTEYNGHPLDCPCDECKDSFNPEPTEGNVYCYGKVVCQNCGKQHGICVDFNLAQPQENEEMINRNQTPAAGQPQQQQRRRSSGGGSGDGIKYLTKADVSVDKRPAKILSTRVQPDNFKPEEDVVSVKILFNGNVKLWTLRMTNPNLDTFIDAWSNDETTWLEKEFNLFLITDEHDGKTQIRAEIITPAPPAKKPRG